MVQSHLRNKGFAPIIVLFLLAALGGLVYFMAKNTTVNYKSSASTAITAMRGRLVKKGSPEFAPCGSVRASVGYGLLNPYDPKQGTVQKCTKVVAEASIADPNVGRIVEASGSMNDSLFYATKFLDVTNTSGVNCITTIYGDANLDGVVDMKDYYVIRDHYGLTTNKGPAEGDLNCDGVVAIIDFGIWWDSAHLPGTPPPVPSMVTPSPAAICKTGVNTFSLSTACPNGYRFMTFKCYDGFGKTLGSDTTCRTAEGWKREAENRCSGRTSCISTPTAKPTPIADCYSCNSQFQCVLDAGCKIGGPRCSGSRPCATPTAPPGTPWPTPNSTSVYFNPSSQTISSGGAFTFSIFMNSTISMVRGVDINVKFDPSVLQITSVQINPAVKNLAGSTYFDNTQGRVSYVGVGYAYNSLFLYNERLISVTGNVKSGVNGGNYVLDYVYPPYATDPQNALIPLIATPGSISVSGP